MEIQTMLWIVLAVIAAIAIVFFQYFHKNKRKGRLHKILAVLRFCTLFLAFLLLINPKFTKNQLFLEKPNLVVLVDNSSSIDDAVDHASLSEKIQSLISDNELSDRFKIERYSFGSQLNQSDSLFFEEKQTNIANALSKIDEIYAKGATAVVLLTDGNQTLGRDYEYLNVDSNISINPVIVGDTTRYEDISIDFVNSNPYAFLKNKFPLEVLISYNGVGKLSKNVTILVNGKNKFRQRLDFDKSSNSKT
ncbi:MAG: VWA domain-containing protein, partial [Allomuricauda sp.]